MNRPFHFFLIDVLLNQYFLALGEFNYDNFTSGPQMVLCYIFFILATFITQLTMLNMLIAIMGDTFSRVYENKEVNATKTKITLMSDLAAMVADDKVDENKKEEENVFLFVVSPDDDSAEGGDEWEGSLNKMTKIFDKRIGALEHTLSKHMENFGTQFEES